MLSSSGGQVVEDTLSAFENKRDEAPKGPSCLKRNFQVFESEDVKPSKGFDVLINVLHLSCQ